jgi:hypothetical protein
MVAAVRRPIGANDHRILRRFGFAQEKGVAMAADGGKLKRTNSTKAPKRKVMAVGKWTGDRWLVRTSMWRYLTSYVISKS